MMSEGLRDEWVGAVRKMSQVGCPGVQCVCYGGPFGRKEKVCPV